jgi:hypothetical protein
LHRKATYEYKRTAPTDQPLYGDPTTRVKHRNHLVRRDTCRKRKHPGMRRELKTLDE